MTLREYIYLDNRRLDTYLAQIGGDVMYDKIPVWSMELNITGPKAAAKQQRHARPLNSHEKVIALEKYLEKNNMLGAMRPRSLLNTKEIRIPFILESFIASRVIIPARSQYQLSQPSLAIWVSLSEVESEGSRGLLCLLEDCNLDDATPRNGANSSAYSVLASMLAAFYKSLPKLILVDHLDTEKRVHVWSKAGEPNIPVTSDQIEGLFEINAFHRARRFLEPFIIDPFGTLESMGCSVAIERKVTVIYRIRDFGPEVGAKHQATSCFGYPIAIWAND